LIDFLQKVIDFSRQKLELLFTGNARTQFKFSEKKIPKTEIVDDSGVNHTP
jgi:hypothetical protein